MKKLNIDIIYEMFMSVSNRITEQEVDGYFSSKNEMEIENYKILLCWIQETKSLLKKRTKTNKKNIVINLAGLISDLVPFFQEEHDQIDQVLGLMQESDPNYTISAIKQKALNNPESRFFLSFIIKHELIGNINELISCLTQKERFIITLFRNKYVHPVLTAYQLKIDWDKKPKAKQNEQQLYSNPKFKNKDKWKDYSDLKGTDLDAKLKNILHKIKKKESEIDQLIKQIELLIKLKISN